MKPKYTPGPWFAEGTGVFTKQMAFYVAETDHPIRSYTPGLAECKANAALIAAAPELFELVRTLILITVNVVDPNDFASIREEAENTIAKIRWAK